MPTTKPFFRLEKTKPSEKKGWIAGFMLSWTWEEAGAFLGRVFRKKGTMVESVGADSEEVKGGDDQ